MYYVSKMLYNKYYVLYISLQENLYSSKESLIKANYLNSIKTRILFIYDNSIFYSF